MFVNLCNKRLRFFYIWVVRWFLFCFCVLIGMMFGIFGNDRLFVWRWKCLVLFMVNLFCVLGFKMGY